MLLLEAIRDGSYDSFIKPPEVKAREAAGERFYPMELASLVHEESSLLARQLRRQAIAHGKNVIIDTVLSNPAAAVQLGRMLAENGYRIEVVDVEVPYEVSAASIEGRWREEYERVVAGELSDVEELGGRWVPSEYARSMFRGEGEPSWPAVAAERLATTVPAVARYRVYQGQEPRFTTTLVILALAWAP